MLDLGTEPPEPDDEACGWSAWIADVVGLDEAVAVAGCCCWYFSYARASAAD